jgi:hypothetical protein
MKLTDTTVARTMPAPADEGLRSVDRREESWRTVVRIGPRDPDCGSRWSLLSCRQA